ncbi:MAG: long-chain fatty acid--CoA ligase [Gammaproteobacteria bacterium]|nr:long-chain fatty acid--CoA ligase [Gammaproteobacteria bacterium]
MTEGKLDVIQSDVANTLCSVVRERSKRSADKLAFRYFDKTTNRWQDYTWRQFEQRICHFQGGLKQLQIKAGDCVGIMLRNCPEWVLMEVAALRLGAITVPLYPNDRPDNVSHIVNQANIKVVLIESQAQYDIVREASHSFENTPMLLSLERFPTQASLPTQTVNDWLVGATPCRDDEMHIAKTEDLATIIYTSGTTGQPKGVMLSHQNILFNARAGVKAQPVYNDDLFLSFLPLSHALERTVGLYIPILCGASVAFARSIPQLAEDLLTIRPTVIITVPRIFEKVYAKISNQLEEKSPLARKLFHSTVHIGWHRFEQQQGRGHFTPSMLLWPVLNKLVAAKVLAKLGGRLRFAISGGAPLPETIAQTFIGLGLPILQGYGLTEASPVISVNPDHNNHPSSIGPALPGIAVRVADDGELQALSPGNMLGYWKNEQATKETFTADGWLKTGDLARIVDNYIYITGRKKEIMVLSNGEKVPPVDIEMAITLDPLFEQAIVIGEQRPYLTAVIVLEHEAWKKLAAKLNVPISADSLQSKVVMDHALSRVSQCMHAFPGYAQIRKIHLSLHTWTDANGLLTASLKMRRKPLMEFYQQEIEKLYA